jgi:hypothetical protein
MRLVKFSILTVSIFVTGCNMSEKTHQNETANQQLNSEQLRLMEQLKRMQQPIVLTDKDYATMSAGNPYRAEMKPKNEQN